jgi:hydroxymethylpyrimidine pyrophosphatase-like HAD family hydrolase
MLGQRAQDWARRSASLPKGRIALVLADVDGVVTPGEGQPADLGVLGRLAAQNRAALEDPETPALALCTGRQAPYVELMAQMTGVFLPCIFEHGAGLYVPDAFQFVFAEQLGSDYAARLAALRAALEPDVLRTGRAFVQPGKEATLTLYPLQGTDPDVLFRLVSPIVNEHDGWAVERNVAHLEVRPRGISKGAGLRRLAELLGLPLTAFAGVGDADPDLSFLSLVGFSAAPANATPAVREAVDYVAPQPFGDGLLNILERCLTIS